LIKSVPLSSQTFESSHVTMATVIFKMAGMQ